MHESLGAAWTVDRGVRVPDHYADADGERRALTEGCGLWDGSASDRLELLGPDRHRFLNGMVTVDIAGLEVGASRYGLFTSLKGRVLADATVLAHPDRLWIRLPPSTGREIREHLSRFVITDQVEILALGDMVPIVVLGPGSSAAIGRWTSSGELPGPGEHRRAEVLGTEVCLLREERLTVEAFSLWISAAVARELVPRLLEPGDAPRPVGLEAMERLRIERGVPRFGSEIGPETFPQEAGVDDAVSYEKGCYLGQEVVARIHFRGGVQRHLVQLEISDAEGPLVGERVSFEGREAGRLTSVAPRFEASGWLGLALLAKRSAESGTVVRLGDGTEARVL